MMTWACDCACCVCLDPVLEVCCDEVCCFLCEVEVVSECVEKLFV